MTFEEFLASTFDPDTAAEILAQAKHEVGRRQRRAEIITKHCRSCASDLPLTAFHKDASKRDGLRAQCRECHKLSQGRAGVLPQHRQPTN